MPHAVKRIWQIAHEHLARWMGTAPTSPAAVSAGPAPAPAAVPEVVPVAVAERLPPSGMPSIAVLPFDNVTGKVNPTYLADGVAGDIATQLSYSNALFVVARQSSLTHNDRPVELAPLGRELGAGHVLGVHVRRDNEQVRIVARLMEAENGKQMWVKHFDRAITDLPEVQDAIADAAALAIAPDISAAERQRIASKPIVSHRMIVGATASGRGIGGVYCT